MSMKSPRSAFTLVETLVAITILTLAVAGPIYVADRAIIAARLAENQLIASYLAQEGVEYARHMRDNEYLSAFHAGGTSVSQSAWAGFLSGNDAYAITQCESSACTLDPTKPAGTGSQYALNPCSGESCTPLYLGSSGIYQQSQSGGATRTPFTRTVQAVFVSSTDERIVSTVSWDFHGVPYVVTVTDHLTPWQ